jgi:von Willebrand factor type A domain
VRSVIVSYPSFSMWRANLVLFSTALNPRDDVFLFAFSTRTFLLQPFTSNHAAVRSRLALLHADGRTALYDAIFNGLIMVSYGRYDKNALLVVTDGMDNSSSSTLDQVVAQARRQGVLIYSIGIGDPNIGETSFFLGSLLIGSGELERVDARTLQMLSNETGAKTYIVRKVADGELLRGHYLHGRVFLLFSSECETTAIPPQGDLS